MRFLRRMAAAGLLVALMVQAGYAQSGGVAGVDSLPDGMRMKLADGDLEIRTVAGHPEILRVMFSKDPAFFSRSSFAVLPGKGEALAGALAREGGAVIFSTTAVRARVDAGTGAVSFLDSTGKLILAELPKGRTLEAAAVQGEATFHVRQQWAADPREGLYGLGQHQFGLVDIKGYDIDLWQHNTEIAIPMLVSSKGYGIFWDNPSYTKFGDPGDFAAIPPDLLVDAQGNAGGLTVTPFRGSNWLEWNMGTPGTPGAEMGIDRDGNGGGGARGRRGGPPETAVRWQGQIRAKRAGTYQFRLYANGGYRMWIDDKMVADHWRQNWLAWDDLVKLGFDAGSLHKIRVEWIKDGGSTCRLEWKPPAMGLDNAEISLWSQVGDGVDYYFVYGGGAGKKATIDRVIAGYRALTGQAPMMPVWAFGLWQSRQRYMTQDESAAVVKEFRDRKIPFDNMVQDWMYWPEPAWGSHDFDPQRFPDPAGWVKSIHDLNAHLMISVWGKFYPSTDNFKALDEKGYLYPVSPVKDWVGRGYQYAFYDAFNPGAREMFWEQIQQKLFSAGVDAWWLDASEPDLVQPSPPTLEKLQADMPKTAAGTGASVMSAYPLLNSQAVYEGQRKAAPDQRVFILTRSAYAGSQRYASAVWSGDISATWTAMKKQIAAGLGYSISGLPYWSMDSGGFSVPPEFWRNNQVPADARDQWNEMGTRWLQFAAFVPIMRVHGENPQREMWEYVTGPGGTPEQSPAYLAQLKIDRLRYRLLPYVYSIAGDATQDAGTFMRPLVMDFPEDERARELTDQYMFGRAIMVSPVTEYKARSREVYLPGEGAWYDFWTGEPLRGDGGGKVAQVMAPYDQIPLAVRAGAIVPMGPELQYTTEKKADPLTLFVYTGTDGDFSLYEDDGLTYRYENGEFSRIPMHWSEKDRTLTIGKRSGAFAGMPAKRTIQVILVSSQKHAGYDPDAKPDKAVPYAGDAVDVKF